MSDISKNKCKGCDARDGIIASLAARIDELEGVDILELPPRNENLPTIEEMSGLIDFGFTYDTEK